MGVAKIGNIMIVRKTARPNMYRWKRNASRNPSTISSVTAVNTKIAVTLTAEPTSSSPKARTKLAKPFQVKLV